ncbi:MULTISPECIES: efflux RND transporter periplasmic adaptor subunit [Salinivibrio]|uniref:Efflux transporter periplasmic adaptor subunit n=1 Tax=Salinivibrio kushneri TaxID=1908198 RepID=A0AB36JSC8_9GAMM|nr:MULTISPECIES: efflux RND transporter periplasmic adaptor subunit [Salinivibrio]ODP99547.1 efflux transporter periplasmic adaptor subunit [Salinivibrio sp. BNH]OOE34850.1 efflux transporter periplasmic adaptor subunit [Salinivibrio kushneri]OOE38696.1 efflux transporter periplasmic adaptor subunit [Salinivibrio kushneri]OOE45304.1 efflux transporter periplasmic adaptor subunit [Salinivibrio kushneri]OOE48377.1 efflux transporter periplasmic adaptor subunit [Salinivibrio kushneri]
MKKWFFFMVILALLLFGSVIGFNLFKQQKVAEYMANMPEPTHPVTAVTVEAEPWTPTLDAIGFIEPNQGITLTTQIAGVVDVINFESGQTVERGQNLVELDSSVEKANLASTQARLPAAEAKFKRYQGLFAKGSISKEALDEAEANYRSLQADINALKATIARRNIQAPFDGVIGLRDVFLGEYLQPGTDIARLEDTSVMKLRFTVPQTDISKIRLSQPLRITVDAYPEKEFIGSISAIEPAVNSQSGLIKVEANIPNNDGQLRSGMFARADIVLPTIEEQIVIDQTAINFNLYGESVYVIREEEGEKRAYQQVLKVGERRGHQARVIEGLQPGDQVVTSGQVRLSNGSKVKIVENDALTPPEQLPQL